MPAHPTKTQYHHGLMNDCTACISEPAPVVVHTRVPQHAGVEINQPLPYSAAKNIYDLKQKGVGYESACGYHAAKAKHNNE